MEHDEIIEMLEDFGTCLGGERFKEVKGWKDYITIQGKIENGDDIFLEYSEDDITGKSIKVNMHKIGLSDCAFYGRTNPSVAVSMLIGNYFVNRRDALTQSDLNAIANINLSELRDAIDIWLK